jgi:hypothetical protein
MQLTRTLGVVVMLAVLGGPASADIYVWRDSAGISHYVNDLENVPSEYRKEAMPVAKDWARAAPPPVAAEPSPTPAAVKPETGPSSSAREIYDAAYAAGFRAGEILDPPSSSTYVGPIVQNVQVLPAEPRIVADHLIPVPVFVERRHRRPKPLEDRGERKRFPPATRAPFLQGAAGPPPLGAAGPPPVRFE